MEKKIYLLPGRGGQLNSGLGAELLSRGYQLFGRELRGEFQRLPFAEQIAAVAEDLFTHFWVADGIIIANSFGAYLFLHAQANLPPFPGRVLLLSPIVGEAQYEERMMFFVPPRAERLRQLIFNGSYPVPTDCEMHVGEEDWQSNPENVKSIGQALNLHVSVVPRAGHRLPSTYVRGVLDAWLPG